MDSNEEVGKASKDAFDKQFDVERTIFVPCDVSDEDKLKGKGKSVFFKRPFVSFSLCFNIEQSRGKHDVEFKNKVRISEESLNLSRLYKTKMRTQSESVEYYFCVF